MVIPPAKTGSLSTKRKAVTQTATRNNGIFTQLKELIFKLFIVHKKFTDPAMELTPAKCNLKITMSTPILGCPSTLLKGGYTVHPVPTPGPINKEALINKPLNGRSQNLRLLRRGKHISCAPNNSGSKRFPNPPIRIGITMKKIIIKACRVTTLL